MHLDRDKILNKAKSHFFKHTKDGLQLIVKQQYNPKRIERQEEKLLRELEVLGYVVSYRFGGSMYYNLKELEKHFENELSTSS